MGILLSLVTASPQGPVVAGRAAWLCPCLLSSILLDTISISQGVHGPVVVEVSAARSSRRAQIAVLDHGVQRVVLDREWQVHAPAAAAGLVDGEDDLGGVERPARAQLRLPSRPQRLD